MNFHDGRDNLLLPREWVIHLSQAQSSLRWPERPRAAASGRTLARLRRAQARQARRGLGRMTPSEARAVRSAYARTMRDLIEMDNPSAGKQGRRPLVHASGSSTTRLVARLAKTGAGALSRPEDLLRSQRGNPVHGW